MVHKAIGKENETVIMKERHLAHRAVSFVRGDLEKAMKTRLVNGLVARANLSRGFGGVVSLAEETIQRWWWRG